MLNLQVDTSSGGVQYEKEFIICSLDLVSGLAEGLGSAFERLVSTLINFLFSGSVPFICFLLIASVSINLTMF